jgi:hypothetical protein
VAEHRLLDQQEEQSQREDRIVCPTRWVYQKQVKRRKENIDMSKTATQSLRKSLTAAAAIAFGIALHPVKANAEDAGAPTDPQIVWIVTTADQIDINYAKLALSKTRNKQVTDFAQQMITDHTSVQNSVSALAAETQCNSSGQRD